jgi:hypothetical protein
MRHMLDGGSKAFFVVHRQHHWQKRWPQALAGLINQIRLRGNAPTSLSVLRVKHTPDKR